MLCFNHTLFAVFCGPMSAILLDLPSREVDSSYNAHFRERFPWSSLAPEKIGPSSQKQTVSYGYVDDPLDVISIPSFERIAALRTLAANPKREDANKLVRVPRFNNPINDYMRNLVGNMFLEIDLMKQFLRIAYGKNIPGYEYPRTAVNFIRYLRDYSKQALLGHSLEFFSARMLMDWLKIFNQKRCFRLEIDRPSFHIWISTNLLPRNSLVHLETAAWKILLNNRLNRLLLTGYENIDL